MTSLDDPRDRAVRAMFDRIAGRYDFLNRVISFRLDGVWRTKVIREVLKSEEPLILDLGSGTGDLTFSAATTVKGNGRIVGLDFSLPMLLLARSKQRSARHGEKSILFKAARSFHPSRTAYLMAS
jgi:demethylmenaquinone methyltransferase/2-methoxy-6-polyprenyl-1,4-benzoquinol methylase